MRKLAVLVAATAATALALTGCSADAKAASVVDAPMVCKHFATGNTAKQIKVSLPASGTPKLSFPTPLSTESTESSVLRAGKGPRFGGNQLVKFEYQSYDAATGKMIQSTAWDGTNAVSQVIQKSATSGVDLCGALAGAREGSVVATIFNAKDSHGGKAYPDAGIGKDDSIIFVFKLLAVNLPRAIGKTMPAQDGFPQVVTSADGTPGLVMENWATSAAPSEFKAETLIQGSGATLKADDWVTVHYSGYLWSPEKTMFDSSWSKNTPANFQLKQGALIPGFIKALVGQKVGSQVVAILPPSEGYGSTGAGSIPANSTLIFVIDILGKGKQ